MGARFLVPWRADGGHRERLWDWCGTHWSRSLPDIPIVQGNSPDGPFNRSAAINDAARGEWDVGVVLDADVIADPAQVRQAMRIASDTGRVTLPYTLFVGLNASMTTKILAGRGQGVSRSWDRGARFRSTIHESSIVCIPRTLWDEVGGFDERFVGWGQEDVAFIQACRILGGEIERVPGVVYHLWHPKSPERHTRRVEYVKNQELGQRYRMATTREAMRELLEGPIERTRTRVQADLRDEWLERRRDEGRPRIFAGGDGMVAGESR